MRHVLPLLIVLLVAPACGDETEEGGGYADLGHTPEDDADGRSDADPEDVQPDSGDPPDVRDTGEPDAPGDTPEDLAEDGTPDTVEDAPADVPEDGTSDAEDDLPQDVPDGSDVPDAQDVHDAQDVDDAPDLGDAEDAPDAQDVSDAQDVDDAPDLSDADLPDTPPDPDAEPDVPDELEALSDEFEGPLGDQWTIIHENQMDLAVEGGALRMTASGRSLWYEGSEGPSVHTDVTGDFFVWARVRARSTANPDQPPPHTVHLGGLMARDPASAGIAEENYVFVVVGHDVNDLSVETKTTMDNRSEFTGPTWPNSDAELLLCRSGDRFAMFKREIGADAWAPADTFDRPDLPSTLHVGPLMYANRGDSDLTVTFDFVRFGADCPAR